MPHDSPTISLALARAVDRLGIKKKADLVSVSSSELFEVVESVIEAEKRSSEEKRNLDVFLFSFSGSPVLFEGLHQVSATITNGVSRKSELKYICCLLTLSSGSQ